jgi:exocyst complex protein 7
VDLENTLPSSEFALRQDLMQMAMKRLQKEFYQILSMNWAHLDTEFMSARSSRTSTRSSTFDYEDDEQGCNHLLVGASRCPGTFTRD